VSDRRMLAKVARRRVKMAKVKLIDRRDEGEHEVFVSVEFELVDLLDSGCLGALGFEKEGALLKALGAVAALEVDLASAKAALLRRLEVCRAEDGKLTFC